MTIMGNNSMTMAEFAELLDVYGSDRARWSAEARAAAAQLVAADPAARRLLAEAEALDRVLNRAPLPGLPVEAALADRIVAAALRSPRIVRLPSAQRAAEDAGADGAVSSGSPHAVGDGSAVVVRAPAVARGGRWGLFRRPTGAAGVLAASLVIGILIGNLNSLSPQLLPALADMVGFTDRDDLVRIALSDEVTL